MEIVYRFIDWIIQIGSYVAGLTEFIPIDLILLAMVAVAFARFIWVMNRYTKVWDNFSRSLVAVFASTGLIYVFVVANAIIGDIPGELIILWFIRIALLISIIWCQHELNKELRRGPSVLFIRDRTWVHRRINNIEVIRSLLMNNPETPPRLLEDIDNELTEMYRFKEVVLEEDRRRGITTDPEWTHNQFYLEKYKNAGLTFPIGEGTEVTESSPAPTTSPVEGGTP